MVYNHFYIVTTKYFTFYNFYKLIFYNFSVHTRLSISYFEDLAIVPYNEDDSMS
jgi:hypothetical protein